MPSLRSLGYRVRAPERSSTLAMLERAGLRPRPLNRDDPRRGHYVAGCPWCSIEDALFVDPGGVWWSTTCACRASGGPYELAARMAA